MSDYPYIAAKSISYGGERAYSAVKYIVIHYTGNNNDTAKNNCDFFHNGNTRSAGAHFFVSQNGDVYQSIQMKKVAYAVGGFVTQKNGAGSYYKKCTNTNSVSIELCDNASKDPSAAQTEAVRKLVAYIRSVCPNATTIIRHWDVSGKSCPARMTGKNSAKWLAFRAAISKTEKPKAENDDMLTDKQIYEAVQRHASTLTVPEGSQKEWEEAKALGITDGSNPCGLIPRHQAAMMALRAYKKAVK